MSGQFGGVEGPWLRSCKGMRGVGLEHWESLTSLTKLSLYKYSELTDRGIVWFGKLVAFRVLDLYGSYKITYFGVRNLAPLMFVLGFAFEIKSQTEAQAIWWVW